MSSATTSSGIEAGKQTYHRTPQVAPQVAPPTLAVSFRTWEDVHGTDASRLARLQTLSNPSLVVAKSPTLFKLAKKGPPTKTKRAPRDGERNCLQSLKYKWVQKKMAEMEAKQTHYSHRNLETEYLGDPPSLDSSSTSITSGSTSPSCRTLQTCSTSGSDVERDADGDIVMMDADFDAARHCASLDQNESSDGPHSFQESSMPPQQPYQVGRVLGEVDSDGDSDNQILPSDLVEYMPRWADPATDEYDADRVAHELSNMPSWADPRSDEFDYDRADEWYAYKLDPDYLNYSDEESSSVGSSEFWEDESEASDDVPEVSEEPCDDEVVDSEVASDGGDVVEVADGQLVPTYDEEDLSEDPVPTNTLKMDVRNAEHGDDVEETTDEYASACTDLVELDEVPGQSEDNSADPDSSTPADGGVIEPSGARPDASILGNCHFENIAQVESAGASPSEGKLQLELEADDVQNAEDDASACEDIDNDEDVQNASQDLDASEKEPETSLSDTLPDDAQIDIPAKDDAQSGELETHAGVVTDTIEEHGEMQTHDAIRSEASSIKSPLSDLVLSNFSNKGSQGGANDGNFVKENPDIAAEDAAEDTTDADEESEENEGLGLVRDFSSEHVEDVAAANTEPRGEAEEPVEPDCAPEVGPQIDLPARDAPAPVSIPEWLAKSAEALRLHTLNTTSHIPPTPDSALEINNVATPPTFDEQVDAAIGPAQHAIEAAIDRLRAAVSAEEPQSPEASSLEVSLITSVSTPPSSGSNATNGVKRAVTEARNTFIGIISLEDFINTLHFSETGLTKKADIINAFVALSLRELGFYGVMSPDGSHSSVQFSSLAQSRVKIGNTTLFCFLARLPFDEDDTTSVLKVADAFRAIAGNDQVGPSNNMLKFLALQ